MQQRKMPTELQCQHPKLTVPKGQLIIDRRFNAGWVW